MSREAVVETYQVLYQAQQDHAAARDEPGTPPTRLSELRTAEAEAAEAHQIAVLDFEGGLAEPEAGG